ncbi:MAG: phage tail protein [Geobacter sp.]
MFLIIGDIAMGQLESPTGFEAKLAISYAEHQVIEGKPLLQYTGDGLDEISLGFMFHADFCDPQRTWDGLKELATSHKAFPLLQGNGLLLGQFVIADISRTTTHAAADGTMYAFEAKLTLREYVDPKPLSTKKKEQQQAAPAVKRPAKKMKRPAKKKDVPQLSAESRKAGYALSQDKQTVVKSATRQS